MAGEIIKCVYMNTCEVDCAFKHGVRFKHLMNTLANVPNSDTVQAYNDNHEQLRRHILDGWFIRCKSLIYPRDHKNHDFAGRLMDSNSPDFASSVYRDMNDF